MLFCSQINLINRKTSRSVFYVEVLHDFVSYLKLFTSFYKMHVKFLHA